jgi:hypothetical protein
MPSPASGPDATTKLRTAIEFGIVAVGALVAVGVSAVFLVLLGADRTHDAPRRTTSNAHSAAPRPLNLAPGVAEDRVMHRRVLTATTVGAFVIGSPTQVVSRASTPLRLAPVHRPHASTGSATHSSRPDTADWVKIKMAPSLRRLALAPHRTSHFRAFAAFLGLSQLASIHPLAPGRCLTAVTDLYNNLLDLENAYPDENWGPLRRAVAMEPSIDACAPRPPGKDRP